MAKKEAVSKTTKSKATPAKSEKAKKGGVRKYFRDLRSELKKVVWPSRKQVVNNTGIVITVMCFMGLLLFGIDSGLGVAIKALLNIGK